MLHLSLFLLHIMFRLSTCELTMFSSFSDQPEHFSMTHPGNLFLFSGALVMPQFRDWQEHHVFQHAELLK